MESGKGRRCHRLLGTQNRTLIVATDDGLISGPTGLLSRMGEILKETTDADGVLMYKGCLERNWEELGQRAAVVNLTASVTGKMHTEKIMCGNSKGSSEKRSGLGSGTRKCREYVRKQDDRKSSEDRGRC